MRLLVTIGYTKVLFGKGAQISELLAAMDGAKIVNEVGGYSEPHKYVITEDAEIGVTIIQENAISLPDVPDNGVFDKFHALAEERDKAIEEARELKKKLKAIEDATIGKAA